MKVAKPPPVLLCSFLAALSLAACSDQSDADEDATADAAPAGKSDAYGFRPGHFVSYSGDKDAGEVQNAVFHENGQLDLSRFVDYYESEYVTGTYKVYRYAQRDRIRLTDDNGRVLLRADWAISSDDKLEIAGVSLDQRVGSRINLVDCIAMRVHDTSLLEEGFTEYEYPEVELYKVDGAYVLDLGSGTFDARGESIGTYGAMLTVNEGAAELTVTAKLDSGEELTMRIPNNQPRRGEITYREGHVVQASLMASIVCQ